MWYEFLPKLLNMSMTGGIVILAVLLARLLLRRVPKIFSYALWAVVLFRLLCPVSLSSPVSVLNVLNLFHSPSTDSGRMEYIPENIVHTEFPAVDIPVPGVSETINNILPQGEEQLAADPMEAPVTILTVLWACGAGALLLYSVVKLAGLRRKLVGAMLLRDNVYLADHISSPFVMGLFRPKIYLPSSLPETEQSYILLHEQHHVRRGDHIVRILAFAALCLHWFNPLVWVAFILSGTDMEMSCDEAVMKELGDEIRQDYSRSLLSLATGKRIIAGTPLAFGEGSPGGRIRNVLNYKKPAFWVVAVGLAVCAVVGVCFAANPMSFSNPENIQGAAVMSRETWEFEAIPKEKGEELAELLQSYRRTSFPVTLDYAYTDSEKMIKTTYIGSTGGESHFLRHIGHGDAGRITCANGDIYLVILDYYKGVHGVFHPLFEHYFGPCGSEHDDDYRSIVIYFPAEHGPQMAWRMECSFDEPFKAWLGAAHALSDSGDDPSPIRRRALTLYDVLMLSPKGDELTWSDFERYQGQEVGSGLHIMRYEIDVLFDVLVGGVPDESPMYIRLRNRDTNAWVDLQNDSVEQVREFIEVYQNDNPKILEPKPDGGGAVPEESISWAELQTSGMDSEFLFCSGAGGWGTWLTVDSSGGFSGHYEDAEMGSNDLQKYPNGTVYVCDFVGAFSQPAQVDEYTLSVQVEQLEAQSREETIEDGIRYLPTTPYGLENADEVLIFLPGKPVGALSEDVLYWLHGPVDWAGDTLPFYALVNVKEQQAFCGWMVKS